MIKIYRIENVNLTQQKQNNIQRKGDEIMKY